MSLIIIGEAATKVADTYPQFAETHPQVPWRSMRGMRNRIAHGYFDINLEIVWETVQSALPKLLKQRNSSALLRVNNVAVALPYTSSFCTSFFYSFVC
jgi:uncharacterized protein with HEPN domain